MGKGSKPRKGHSTTKFAKAYGQIDWGKKNYNKNSPQKPTKMRNNFGRRGS